MGENLEVTQMETQPQNLQGLEIQSQNYEESEIQPKISEENDSQHKNFDARETQIQKPKERETQHRSSNWGDAQYQNSEEREIQIPNSTERENNHLDSNGSETQIENSSARETQIRNFEEREGLPQKTEERETQHQSSKDEETQHQKSKGTGEMDAEFFSCLLQPIISNVDPSYVAMRRLLLSRKVASGCDQRKDWKCNGRGYVAFRNYIQQRKNGESLHVPSQPSTPGQSGRWGSSPGLQSILYEAESLGSSRDLQGFNSALSHCTSFSSTLSESDRPLRFAEPAYSFVGMHCIFDNCKASVTILKFGHMSSDTLAYGASDGSLTVCTVSQPPAIIQQLKGHSKDVTDFAFSSNNQYIASASMDKTVRIWEISKGLCIRVIYGVSPQLCICFHPVNNNFLTVGTANKEITVINFSTGRVVNKAVFGNAITAMDNDHTGQLIFAGALSKTHRNRNNTRTSPITTVQYRTFSLLARGPVLLACSQDGSLFFFSVALEIQGYLTLRCSLKLAPRVHNIHASFCPLLSLEKGEFVVSGSEDSNVYFYDLTRPKHICVNKLQGHGSPVIGIAWNHGENLLASSDSDGTVIVWKREKVGSR
ncbi:WD repeat-containing protein 13 isoform X2 [Amborella trichopoda]|uniref:WD repeat-containing protein 13 isoform X2 n=1 Tax=Amborella trichopoda TaxID=13333 RepID=UPI0009BFE5E5|nr:WD repeat-containing protein 13 isoform X2 [Amborella trichopoda]|eukprot:XP_020519973.1 WD repeat-containing protein 13 isoform X2 [Amborella trichopoda]